MTAVKPRLNAWRSPLLLGILLACCAAVLAVGSSRAAAEPTVGLVTGWGTLNGEEPPGSATFSSEAEERNWEVIEQSGVSTLRFQFSWFTKLAEGGWEKSYDRYVEKAARHGITLMGYFYGREFEGGQQFYTAAEAGSWLSEFVEPAVARYGEGGAFWAEHPSVPYRPITAWEVWNEPNLKENNPGEVVNPAAYRELLKVTSEAIRNAAKPRQYPNNARVLFGGIYQGGKVKESVDYFNEVAEGQNLFPYFDGVGIHPYAFGEKGATEATRLADFKEKVKAMRTAVSALCAECNKETLWVTEIGWPLAGVNYPVSEFEQAWLLAASFNWMRSESATLNLPFMAWYDLRDSAEFPKGAWYEHCGLRAWDGSYRQSWWQFVNQATGHPLPGSGGVQMLLDSAGQVWGMSMLGKGWVLEAPAGHTAISAGGEGLQMILDGGGQIWAKNTVGSGGWTKETGPGNTKISAGAKGLQMLIDGSGQIWATGSIGGIWVQETPPGQTAISAGYGGLQMLLESGTQIWATGSIGGIWVQETPPGQSKISAGGGIQMLLDNAGRVWATTSIGGAWVQETPPGHTAIDAGEGGLQMILDETGRVWARTGVGATWTLESGPGQKAISAGSGGLQMRLDSKGQIWAKGSIGYGGWALESQAGNAAISAG